MKKLRNIVLGLVVFLALLVGALYVTGYGYLVTAVRTVYLHGHKTAFLDDYPYFHNRVMHKSTHPEPWAISKDYNKVPLTKEMLKWHEKTGTVAFLIVKNDSVWSESYFDGYGEISKSNSFSMAKSVVSAALGSAILEGKARLDQKVSDFYPQFKDGKSSTMTLGDLSSMSSGLDWDENYYSPFSITTRAYFDENLDAVILSQHGVDTPGQSYKYLSGNTQLLAMCLQKATGEELSHYVDTHFFQPMGFEQNAYWQTDRQDGTVKAYCCIASNARDFARFGKLYLQHGKWNGRQIVDSAFVSRSVHPRFKDSPQYGYGWWLAEYQKHPIFYMRGHLGQYVIVVPDQQLIVVRLGNFAQPSSTGNPHSDDFWVWIKGTFEMLAQRRTQSASLAP